VSCGCSSGAATLAPVDKQPNTGWPGGGIRPDVARTSDSRRPTDGIACSCNFSVHTGGCGSTPTSSCGGSTGCGCSGRAKHASSGGLHPPVHGKDEDGFVDPVRGGRQPLVAGLDVPIGSAAPIVVPAESLIRCLPAHEELRPPRSFWDCKVYYLVHSGAAPAGMPIMEPPQSLDGTPARRPFARSAIGANWDLGGAVPAPRPAAIMLSGDAQVACHLPGTVFARFAVTPVCPGEEHTVPDAAQFDKAYEDRKPSGGGGGGGAAYMEDCWCDCACPQFVDTDAIGGPGGGGAGDGGDGFVISPDPLPPDPYGGKRSWIGPPNGRPFPGGPPTLWPNPFPPDPGAGEKDLRVAAPGGRPPPDTPSPSPARPEPRIASQRTALRSLVVVAPFSPAENLLTSAQCISCGRSRGRPARNVARAGVHAPGHAAMSDTPGMVPMTPPLVGGDPGASQRAPAVLPGAMFRSHGEEHEHPQLLPNRAPNATHQETAATRAAARVRRRLS